MSYGYKAPITKARLKEIADHIEEVLELLVGVKEESDYTPSRRLLRTCCRGFDKNEKEEK